MPNAKGEREVSGKGAEEGGWCRREGRRGKEEKGVRRGEKGGEGGREKVREEERERRKIK